MRSLINFSRDKLRAFISSSMFKSCILVSYNFLSFSRFSMLACFFFFSSFRVWSPVFLLKLKMRLFRISISKFAASNSFYFDLKSASILSFSSSKPLTYFLRPSFSSFCLVREISTYLNVCFNSSISSKAVLSYCFRSISLATEVGWTS